MSPCLGRELQTFYPHFLTPDGERLLLLSLPACFKRGILKGHYRVTSAKKGNAEGGVATLSHLPWKVLAAFFPQFAHVLPA